MSVTAVPIQPVKKGTLITLWVGIALAILLAGGLAWAAKLPTIEITTVTEGKGDPPQDGDVVLVNYKGTLADGTEFDAGQQTPLQVSGVVPGFSEGLKKMQKGGKYTLEIPSELAYGSTSPGPGIPANADLTFEVELIDFKSEEEIRAMQQQMQQMQMQQQMQQQGGMPQGIPLPPPGN